MRPSLFLTPAARTIAILLLAILTRPPATSSAGLPAVVDAVQPTVVKIHGAGGFRGLEAYQSGIVISDTGHILTAWSYVLDSDRITVTLSDGRRFDAHLLGADPTLEVAVLTIKEAGLPHFRLEDAAPASLGTRVLAVANVFDVAAGNEPLSVLHGWVSAIGPLTARRGTHEIPYHGEVYLLDAISNNPGAAGGALIDFQGRLLGLIGKELRDARSGVWINYAIPISKITPAVDAIVAGRRRPVETAALAKPEDPWTYDRLGLLLVPDLLPKTPAFVEQVRAGSLAEEAGLRADDLIVLAEGCLVASCSQFRELVTSIERTNPIHVSVIRDQSVIELTIAAPEGGAR
ncbi:MAG: S1C family serine protease [Pirellulales bacterium]